MPEQLGRNGSTVALAASTSQVAVARRFVRRALAGIAPAGVASDLQLIVSELFTNAVQHGDGDTIDVSIDVDGDAASVVVDCRSPAPGVGPIDSWEIADEDEVTGRGLGIVRRLADVVQVERAQGGFRVSARKSFTCPA